MSNSKLYEVEQQAFEHKNFLHLSPLHQSINCDLETEFFKKRNILKTSTYNKENDLLIKLNYYGNIRSI